MFNRFTKLEWIFSRIPKMGATSTNRTIRILVSNRSHRQFPNRPDFKLIGSDRHRQKFPLSTDQCEPITRIMIKLTKYLFLGQILLLPKIRLAKFGDRTSSVCIIISKSRLSGSQAQLLCTIQSFTFPDCHCETRQCTTCEMRFP